MSPAKPPGASSYAGESLLAALFEFQRKDLHDRERRCVPPRRARGRCRPLYSWAMSTICRREALLAMALLAPGGRALYALQSRKAKPATVTLIISGMT